MQTIKSGCVRTVLKQTPGKQFNAQSCQGSRLTYGLLKIFYIQTQNDITMNRPDFRYVMICLVTTFYFLQPIKSLAQNNETPPARELYKEILHDAYMPLDQDNMKTSAAVRGQSDRFFYTQVNINEFGENIMGDAANEPSIAVDPTNPNRIMIGWRQFDNVNSNFRQAGYAFTNDGGETWVFPGVIEPTIFRSDPVLASNSEGEFYYNSLTTHSGDFTCDQFKSTTDGEWDQGTYAYGGDKQWMTVDQTTEQGNGNIYAFWSAGPSVCGNRQFTRSTDANQSFENCSIIPKQPYWGSIATGSTGDLYVAGLTSDGISLIKSTNAKNAAEAVEWTHVSTVTLDGYPVPFAGMNSPNPDGLHGQIWIDIDRSQNTSPEHIYVLASVDPFNSNDPCDVMLTRSTDGGLSWDSPIKINNDESVTNWQWFGTMSVAPNGRIDVIWLDTRNNPGTFLSQLYYSYSDDDGTTWAPNEVLVDIPFDPHLGWPQQNKMGDYFHMTSDNEGADLAWAATFNGEQDVYYGRINSLVVGNSNIQSNQATNLKIYPNPARDLVNISFSIKHEGLVQLGIRNNIGQTIAEILNENKTTGDYLIQFNFKSTNSRRIASGYYSCELKIDNKIIETQPLIIID